MAVVEPSPKQHDDAIADSRARDDAARTVIGEQTRLLYSNLLLSSVVSIVAPLLLAAASRAHVAIEHIAGWVGLMAAVSALRLALLYRWRISGLAESATSNGTQRWLAAFEVGAFAGGSAWGCAAIWMYPADSVAHQVFLGFVLACIAAGGLGTLAVHLKSYMLFLVPTLLPYAARQFYEGGELQIFVGSVFTLGIGFLLVSARRFEAVTVSSLALRHDNDRLVDALRLALHDAEDANRAKTRFLADMSFQIRTPLSGMIGMAEILQKTRLTPHQRRLAGSVSQSADTLLALVEDVLDITRIESGTFVLDERAFDLRATIEDAVDLCAGAGYRRGLEIHLIVEQPLPLQVVGDAKRLHQVLIGLIGYTATSTRAGQITLRVTCEAAGGCRYSIRFSILDNGSGLADRQLEQLLSPISPSAALAARRTDAKSLALASAGKLVEMMGGAIELTNSIGQGSTIGFTLSMLSPLAGEHALEGEAKVLSGKRVMILDDRPLSREAIASRIRCPSATIDLACSEEEALSRLRLAAHEGRPYHLVLIDRIRPRCDSLAVHRKVVTSPDLSGIKVIAMMPMHWTLDEATEREFGAGAFLSKPIRRAALLAAIERAMRPLRTKDIAQLPTVGADLARLGKDERPAVAGNRLEGLLVLVAEDDPVNQEMALAFLESFGCAPAMVSNGLEAIEAFEHRKFDAILMDCQMPEVDGLAAIRHIRTREQVQGQHRLPIVMVTANAFSSDRDMALEAGADAYLAKPYSEQQLRSVVVDVVERAAARRAAA